MKRLMAGLADAALALSVFGVGAVAGPDGKSRSDLRSIDDGVIDTALENSLQAEGLDPKQPGLPESSKNMKLVSKLQLTETDGVISDVSYHKGPGFALTASSAGRRTSAPMWRASSRRVSTSEPSKSAGSSRSSSA